MGRNMNEGFYSGPVLQFKCWLVFSVETYRLVHSNTRSDDIIAKFQRFFQ